MSISIPETSEKPLTETLAQEADPIEANSDSQSSNSDQAVTMKDYQQTLQELKEEISRLNKKLDQRSRENKSTYTDEDIFKLKHMCKFAKDEVKTLTEKLENLKKIAESNQENFENIKISYDEDNEKAVELSQKIRDLEDEYSEINKSSNEISISELDKLIQPDVSPKLVNEFFVSVQKRLTALESENSALSAALKKNINETNKLKEKCDKAALRYKSNDELKNKLKELEETNLRYCLTETRLNEDMKIAEEEYLVHLHRPENKYDQEGASKLLDEIEKGIQEDREMIEKLEVTLQEKKNVLRAARAYGMQRSKTSNKLRNDMEVLGLLLIEKDQSILKLKKEIEEIKLKNSQIEIEKNN